MKVLNLLMRLVMLVFWVGIAYALLGPGIEEAGSMPLILGGVVLFMHLLQMLMLRQVAGVLHPTVKDYIAVLVFGSFAMHHHRARLKELMAQKR
ncbi:hypothetical protein CGX12_04675 [Zobellella denitrificans]|jgi:uncharacterized protein YhhL (DUF1145 family)|uniref:Uncharacterized protein n=1 Tax=Zobellella denitrificans TaxID=347534 RepID=A0A231N2G2_9GAMM|nr:DUF1145 domain-containing protein [Zobellella denitrificans]ATG75564.1 hypothetical protein AN401_18320 [Zobellella denitrificans]OXS16335.1 hypothetical protein CGX12_04675 [Zobellella denitrificans]